MRSSPSPMRLPFLALAIPAMGLLATGCSRAPALSEGPEPVPTVAIRAEVGGVLQKVHFREGQDVRVGDLLFTLDPRPFAAALESAEAALARDSVQHETASHDVERYASLA